MATCPMCRSPHARLGSTRPVTALRRAPAALRRSNLAYVGRLSAAQKGQHGRHPEYGRLTIPQMLAHWAEHDLSHLEQIRAAHRRLAGRRRLRP